jgi:antitoxin ParD1/3/4
MANVEKISIALPTDMASLVRCAVETGDYASSSEVMREALREWKARRAARSDAISEIRRLGTQVLRAGRVGISILPQSKSAGASASLDTWGRTADGPCRAPA